MFHRCYCSIHNMLAISNICYASNLHLDFIHYSFFPIFLSFFFAFKVSFCAFDFIQSSTKTLFTFRSQYQVYLLMYIAALLLIEQTLICLLIPLKVTIFYIFLIIIVRLSFFFKNIFHF